MANSRSANRLLTPRKGEGYKRVSSLPRLVSDLAVDWKWWEAGRGPKPLNNFYTWPGFPRPAGVLALMEDTAVAAGLHQGPDLGVHHPAALPKRDRSGAAALHKPRFMTRAPARTMGRIMREGRKLLVDRGYTFF